MDNDIRLASQQLTAYLNEACVGNDTTETRLLSSRPDQDSDGVDGWFMHPPSPSDALVTRRPWSQMADVDVVPTTHAVTVSFAWRAKKSTVFIAIMGYSGMNPTSESDRWITMLDLALDDADRWIERSIFISDSVRVIVLDPRTVNPS